MIELAKVPTGMSLVLAVSVAILLLMLWNFHRDQKSHVDLADLICHEGQISEAKFARLGAFIVSTWGFVYLILDERFSEWYFAGYMTAWCGNALVNKYLNTKDSAAPRPPAPPATP